MNFAAYAYGLLMAAEEQEGGKRKKGVPRDLDLQRLARELEAMPPEDAGDQLMELAYMEGSGALVRALVAELEDWGELFDCNVDLDEYR